MAAPVTITWEKIRTENSVGIVSQFISGIFVQLLRNLFATPQQLEFDVLKKYTWHEDDKESRILIEWMWSRKFHLVEQRPALLVRDGPIKPHRTGIGNDRIQGGKTAIDGGELFAKLKTSSVTVFAIGREAAEAKWLATEAEHYLTQMGEVIRCDFNLLAFEPLDMGAVGKVEESQDHFAVPITYGLAWWDFFRVLCERPKLKTLSISADLVGLNL